jgi:hypothetical protein
MLHTIEVEVEVDSNGRGHPLEPLARLPAGRTVLTLLDSPASDSALLAEAALAEGWLKPEEDDAWAHLRPAKS